MNKEKLTRLLVILSQIVLTLGDTYVRHIFPDDYFILDRTIDEV